MSKTDNRSLAGKCALITGAGRRIGAAIALELHAAGAAVAIHHRHSAIDASELAAQLNASRSGSAATFEADLNVSGSPERLVHEVLGWCDGIDVLVNNASAFYPTPMGSITEEDWDKLMGSNLKAPLFLSQAAWQTLRARSGCIINIVDIHSQRPLRNHSVYGSAKAGLAMLTRSLAKDMAPDVRVNGISPGAIMWPENDMKEDTKDSIIAQIPLGRSGDPGDIAECVLFLARDAAYVTGQVLAVDGGRSLGW